MTLTLLEFAGKHPTLATTVSGMLAKHPETIPPILQSIASASVTPLATAVTANPSPWSTIFQAVLAYIGDNPQIIGDLINLIAEFLPKA